MIQHELGDEITSATHRILYPCSADHTLHTGMVADLILLRGKDYVEMRKTYREQDRASMLQQKGFFYSLAVPLVLVPVKDKPMNNPAVDAALIGAKVAVQCKKYGCASVAIAKSRWLSMRYNAQQIQELIDALEKGGMEVHVYE